MNYLQPYLWYLICAMALCIIYFGIEKSNGKLGFTAKAVLSSWCLISLIVTSALFGMQSMITSGRPPPPQMALVTFGASIITLCISSSCVYCAQ
jgi:hypothetical protein